MTSNTFLTKSSFRVSAPSPRLHLTNAMSPLPFNPFCSQAYHFAMGAKDIQQDQGQVQSVSGVVYWEFCVHLCNFAWVGVVQVT